MRKKKVLIFGGKGFVGSHLKGERSLARVYSLDDILAEIAKKKPDVMINCIGYTGKENTDDCEAFSDYALNANSFLPVLFAEAAIRTGVKLVHVSSGCMFKTETLVEEDVIPNFYDLFYSRTKIYGEAALYGIAGYGKANILIVRPRIPFFDGTHPRDILYKIQRFKKVIDYPNSMTYLPDFGRAVDHLIKKDATGIYNIVNPGVVTYAKILKECFGKKAVEMKYTDLKTARTNLTLSCYKLIESGFKPMNTLDAIKEGLRGRK